MDSRLKTGSQALDEFLEGGYETSVITTIFGPSGTGKTTACLLSAISAAKSGKVIFIDTEGGFSTERLKQLSPEYKQVLERIFLLKPTTFEEQKNNIDSLNKKLPKSVSLIICDTISALYRVERGGDNQQLNAELGRQIGKLLEISRKNEIPVIMTNQVYADFTDKTKVRMVGGDIITYNSKCMIELQPIGNSRKKAILKKHRSLPEREAMFRITGQGFEGA
ncbi:DNA repair and recombination protein RadB [Candidatus Woesearchaeota archaeon]|nr:DNA repair and recombination protein RadB [Candidatus Woesearchaeota archaeon]